MHLRLIVLGLVAGQSGAMRLPTVTTITAPPPVVQLHATYEVTAQLGVPYALGVLCDPQPCPHGKPQDVGELAGSGYDCTVCQEAEPVGAMPPIAPTPGCKAPRVFNLTLDLYTPIGAEALGPRPAFIATHSGGYATNSERGFAPTFEMTAACKYFAARGYIALTMVYRLDNGQTGGGLAPTNWSAIPSPLGKGWKGGFLPSPQAIYPAVRDSKAAIRWLRGQGAANALPAPLAPMHVSAGGWSNQRTGWLYDIFCESRESLLSFCESL